MVPAVLLACVSFLFNMHEAGCHAECMHTLLLSVCSSVPSTAVSLGKSSVGDHRIHRFSTATCSRTTSIETGILFR
jgi:hypothetical protein